MSILIYMRLPKFNTGHSMSTPPTNPTPIVWRNFYKKIKTLQEVKDFARRSFRKKKILRESKFPRKSHSSCTWKITFSTETDSNWFGLVIQNKSVELLSQLDSRYRIVSANTPQHSPIVCGKLTRLGFFSHSRGDKNTKAWEWSAKVILVPGIIFWVCAYVCAHTQSSLCWSTYTAQTKALVTSVKSIKQFKKKMLNDKNNSLYFKLIFIFYKYSIKNKLKIIDL